MISEDHLEQLALTWFQDSGWEYCYGPDIAPDGAAPERTDYRQVVLTERLLDALRRLNPGCPSQCWTRWRIGWASCTSLR